MQVFNVGDRVRVTKTSEECGYRHYMEDYGRAMRWTEEGRPLIIGGVGHGSVYIEGLNNFKKEQIELFNDDIVTTLLSTYETDDNLEDEDKLIIKEYVKNNKLIELSL